MNPDLIRVSKSNNGKINRREYKIAVQELKRGLAEHGNFIGVVEQLSSTIPTSELLDWPGKSRQMVAFYRIQNLLEVAVFRQIRPQLSLRLLGDLLLALPAIAESSRLCNRAAVSQSFEDRDAEHLRLEEEYRRREGLITVCPPYDPRKKRSFRRARTRRVPMT